MYFPTIRYHADGRVAHIQTNVELLTYGPEWSETPPAAEVVESPLAAGPQHALGITVPISFSEPKKGRKKQ